MKKIILLFITIISFFGFYSLSNAEVLVSTSPSFVYIGKTLQNGLNSPFSYGVTMNGDVYSFSSSGVTSVTPIYSSGTVTLSESVVYIFNTFNGSSTYIINYFGSNIYLTYIDNVNFIVGKQYFYSPGDGPFKFFVLNNIPYFGKASSNYYYYFYTSDSSLTYGHLITDSIVSPITLGTVEDNFNSDFIIAPNNNVLTCSVNSNTYNRYSWGNDFTANHQSISIPSFYSTSFGNSCHITYDWYNNRTGFSYSDSVKSISVLYIPGSGFVNPLYGKYYTNLYNSNGDTFSNNVDFPNSDGITFSKISGFSGRPLKYLNLGGYLFNNNSYIYYVKSDNSSYTYSNQEGNNGINTIVQSGTSINQINNNPINNNNINNNYNNNYNSFSGTTNVNIPGKCSFGKKLDPLYYNQKWWCQVDNSDYTCPYGNPTTEFIYDGYFCEVQHEPNNSNSGTQVNVNINDTGSLTNDDKGFFSGLFNGLTNKLDELFGGTGETIEVGDGTEYLTGFSDFSYSTGNVTMSGNYDSTYQIIYGTGFYSSGTSNFGYYSISNLDLNNSYDINLKDSFTKCPGGLQNIDISYFNFLSWGFDFNLPFIDYHINFRPLSSFSCPIKSVVNSYNYFTSRAFNN